MRGHGEIVAVDRNEERLTRLRDNLRRLDVVMVRPHRLEWAESRTSGLPLLRTPFDRVMLDAPCSALGILRRHPEGKWQKQPERLVDHQRVQRRLLELTSRLLRPGGVIVYSTCSVEPEETEQVIDHFCEAHPEFERESVAPWVPPAALPLVTDRGAFCSVLNTQGMDAFFAARLKRVG